MLYAEREFPRQCQSYNGVCFKYLLRTGLNCPLSSPGNGKKSKRRYILVLNMFTINVAVAYAVFYCSGCYLCRVLRRYSACGDISGLLDEFKVEGD